MFSLKQGAGASHKANCPSPGAAPPQRPAAFLLPSLLLSGAGQAPGKSREVPFRSHKIPGAATARDRVNKVRGPLQGPEGRVSPAQVFHLHNENPPEKNSSPLRPVPPRLPWGQVVRKTRSMREGLCLTLPCRDRPPFLPSSLPSSPSLSPPPFALKEPAQPPAGQEAGIPGRPFGSRPELREAGEECVWGCILQASASGLCDPSSCPRPPPTAVLDQTPSPQKIWPHQT